MESPPLPEDPTNAPILSQRRPLAFACSQCGECCSQVSVPIEKDKSARLQALPWAQSRLRTHEAQILPLDADNDLLPHTPQGYCVFLRDDGRCEIQAREGAELKPSACMRYPFAAIALPDASLGFDYSISCKSIADSLAQQRDGVIPAAGMSWEALEGAFPRRVRVDAFCRIDWRAFEAYREAVAELFSEPARSCEDALRGAQKLLAALRARKSPGNSLEKLKIAPPGGASPAWLQNVLVWLMVRRPYGALSLWALLVEGNYADPKVLGRSPASLKGLSCIAWDASALDPLVNAFLAAFLRRYAFIAYGHSLQSILLMAVVALALIRWYARLLTLIQDKPSPGVAETRLAIRLVERYYTGHQPAFPQRFRWIPAKGALLDLILSAQAPGRHGVLEPSPFAEHPVGGHHQAGQG
ncbi:MAG: YkgJ family cysteine cluster protein [Vampirovibrionales bacterium]|nr:YkgJ family cysteine cluster protein [Vampirovibrionales bacterium]